MGFFFNLKVELYGGLPSENKRKFWGVLPHCFIAKPLSLPRHSFLRLNYLKLVCIQILILPK